MSGAVVPASRQAEVTGTFSRRFMCSVCAGWKPGEWFTPRKFAWMPIVCMRCDEQMKREN